KEIIGITIFKERNMFIAERFISGLIKVHGPHPVSTDGGTWYPQACRFLKLPHTFIPFIRKALLKELCNT
ncbi:MAG: hypothetical protein M3Z01_02160, partial [Thermoproteota archaeon]|nr:hypothetical protein [Thermoproteota archaeon]